MTEWLVDHNDDRFLAVRCWRVDGDDPGWYVVRVCPCHRNEPVTVSYPTRARAEGARHAILAADSPRSLRPRLAQPRKVRAE